MNQQENDVATNEATFFDLAPGKAVIEVGGNKITVHAVPFAVLLDLCAKFPALESLLVGGKLDAKGILDAIGYGGEALGNLIAAAMRHPYEDEYIAKAKDLDFDQCLDFINGIFEATMPNGIDPFRKKIDKIRARLLIEEVKKSAPAATPDSPSPDAPAAANDQPKFERIKMTKHFGQRSSPPSSPEVPAPQ